MARLGLFRVIGRRQARQSNASGLVEVALPVLAPQQMAVERDKVAVTVR